MYRQTSALYVQNFLRNSGMCTACLQSASFSLTTQLEYFKTTKKRSHGRFHGFGANHSNQKDFKRTMLRTFSREMMKSHGTEFGLEETKLIFSAAKQGVFRRLDEKKKRQLSNLYMDHLSLLFSMNENLANLGAVITKIEIPNVMNEILIYWKCQGNGQDPAIEEALEAASSDLRKKLSESFYATDVPHLKFIGDRRHLYEEEINKLFELADYGEQYRAVSNVGAILGSTKETGMESPENKSKRVPRWIKKQIKKKTEKEGSYEIKSG